MKKTFLGTLLNLIPLIIFNFVFYLVGGTYHPASVWISYVFIHLAYLMMAATPVLTRGGRSSGVFGFALHTISIAYFWVEFIIGLLFILIAADSYKFALIVQVLLAGVYAVILIVNLLANEQTADAVERQETEVFYIKDTASRVKMLIDKASDKTASRQLERLYDLIHASPTRSHPNVKSLEADIKNSVTALSNAVSCDDTSAIIQIAQKISSTVEERNRILKML